MTTPSINTPHAVIQDALVDCGLLMEGTDASPDQFASGLRRLRDLINYLQVKSGAKLWLNVDTPVPLTAGVARYSFGPGGDVALAGKPLKVVQGYYLYNTSNVRRQLNEMPWQGYLSLGMAGTGISNQGPITQYFVDKQQSLLYVTFWLTPEATEAANGQVRLLLQIQATQPIQLDETINFPDEWRMALRWGLADDWATGQPQAVIDRCARKAEQYRIALEESDVEDASVTIGPERGFEHSSFT